MTFVETKNDRYNSLSEYYILIHISIRNDKRVKKAMSRAEITRIKIFGRCTISLRVHIYLFYLIRRVPREKFTSE